MSSKVFWLCILAGCSAASPSTSSSAQTLVLVQETKLSRALPADLNHFEASGITVHDDSLYIAFDNSSRLGVLDSALAAGRLTSGSDESSQYESLTTSDAGFLAAVEGTATRIVPIDADGNAGTPEDTDVAFANSNRGVEGLARVVVEGAAYLLALCEGNYCTDDTTSTGNGRIKVLSQSARQWVTEMTLELPTTVAFADYSDLALRARSAGGYDVAVLSQQSSALWLGVLMTQPFRFEGAGAVYGFPTNDDGAVMYCSLEGVTFLSNDTLAMVSDRTDQADPCADEDESAHIFRLP